MVCRRYVKEGGKTFFHADRRTASADISGDRQQLFHRDHLRKASVSTIMPALKYCVSSCDRFSKSIRTGIRCCTLTKFPAELSVGTNEYLEPVASEIAVTSPVEYLSRQCVYLDTYFLPDIDVGDLGLLVIGRDPFVFISYEVGYRLSGLHVLSGL